MIQVIQYDIGTNRETSLCNISQSEQNVSTNHKEFKLRKIKFMDTQINIDAQISKF